MPTFDQIVQYLTAGIAALVTISVPLGLLGSAIELFGARFGFPKVEALGDKIEKFFFDLPGLLSRKPAASSAAPKSPPLPLLVLTLALLLLPGCAFWSSAKPVVRTINDIARDLCTAHFGEKSKLSAEEVAREFCETRDDLAPWVDSLLAAKQGAAAKAEAARQ